MLGDVFVRKGEWRAFKCQRELLNATRTEIAALRSSKAPVMFVYDPFMEFLFLVKTYAFFR
jgi:hypothetical protein